MAARSLKDIKRRIKSVKNTQQITKAMKLVSAAKLRKAQEAVETSRPYAEKMRELLEGIAMRSPPGCHPLLARREVKKILVVLFSGDKGLCGPFNSQIIRAAAQLIRGNQGRQVSLLVVGKRGNDFFRKRETPVLGVFLDYSKRVGYTLAEEIAAKARERFLAEEADVVYLVYNRFKNVVVQEATALPLLPVDAPSREEDEGPPPDLVDYEYEPSMEAALDEIANRYVVSQIYRALVESAASEHGARMTAMDAATKNAKEMIESLTLEYNRARQAAITKELIEVVSGADALEG